MQQNAARFMGPYRCGHRTWASLRPVPSCSTSVCESRPPRASRHQTPGRPGLIGSLWYRGSPHLSRASCRHVRDIERSQAAHRVSIAQSAACLRVATFSARLLAATSYYISSLQLEAGEFNRQIRAHWAIENSCHWVMDMTFAEDDCRIRVGDGAQNFAILRRIALNLIKQEKSTKTSVNIKRLQAGWSTDYLETLLGLQCD